MTKLIAEIDTYLKRLFPICRSITGNGNRETLRILQEIVPLTIHEVPSGTQVYDWVVPDEWNIFDAWIATPDGHRIVDFRQCNLHVVSYSEPIRTMLNWDDLQPHLHIHPKLPDAIPYRTSYYKRDWGFCVTHSQYNELKQFKGPFDVVIDSTLAPGSLTYGELLLPGKSKQEILISTYICHPSMANDNLSGMVMTAFLARFIQRLKGRHWSYRIVFVPETIGAITYCAINETFMKEIDIGLVITTVGGPGKIGYKKSWNPKHPINRIIEEIFNEAGIDFVTYPFDIHGSDERQYSSQAFRINCATICKDRYYEYMEYHSSFDNLAFVTSKQIAQVYELYKRLIVKIEKRRIYRNRIFHCEVMLSRHGLYPANGGVQRPVMSGKSELDLILWLLFLCDGRKSLEDIIYEVDENMDVAELSSIASLLAEKNILEPV